MRLMQYAMMMSRAGRVRSFDLPAIVRKRTAVQGSLLQLPEHVSRQVEVGSCFPQMRLKHSLLGSPYYRIPFQHDILRKETMESVQAAFFSTRIKPDSNMAPESQADIIALIGDQGSKKSEVLELVASKEPGSLDKAYRHLRELICRHDGTPVEESYVECLEAILAGLLSRSKIDAKATALQAQTIFTEMKDLSRAAQDPGLQPSAACYRDLITAWALAKYPEQAERVFWELLLPEENLPIKTNKDAYVPAKGSVSKKNVLSHSKSDRALLGQSLNRILEAWAHSGKAEAGRRCDDLLSRLDRTQLPRGVSVNPNPESFHFLWNAWRMSLELTPTEKLTPKYFGRVARRLQAIVDFMMKRHQNTKNFEWFPDSECYLWLSVAYGHAGAPEKAQKTLETLLKLSVDNDEIRGPSTAMYNHVLNAWARKGKPQEAALLLSKWVSRCQNQLEALNQTPEGANNVAIPDHSSCLLVIHGWGQFPNWDYASKAEVILNRMHELQNAPEPHARVLPAPTVETYNAVLEAWSRSSNDKIAKACTNAERILEAMHDHSNDNRDNPCAPNERTYELVIETYARFGYRLYHRKKRVQKLVRKMKHYGYEPNDRIKELVELCQEQDKRIS